MSVCQNLSSVNNARYPIARAFCYLRRIIAISNQFSDERGVGVMLCEEENTT